MRQKIQQLLHITENMMQICERARVTIDDCRVYVLLPSICNRSIKYIMYMFLTTINSPYHYPFTEHLF